MKKKILIGSIIAIAILIGVSFTSVVGYQSNSRTIAEASPLFTVRSSRALDVDSKDLTYNYVGKGEITTISLPERNDRIEAIDNLINLIKRMDDKSIPRFANLITFYINKNDVTPELDYKDVFLSLVQLRDNPNIVIKDIQDNKDSKILTNLCSHLFTTPCMSPLQCLTMWLYIFGVVLIVGSLIYIYLFLTLLFRCNTHNS